MDSRLRERVLERDRYCLKCGIVLGDNVAVHHRQLRSQGGKDSMSNLIALHHNCHNVHKGSVHQEVLLSVERGYLVPSWHDPASTPIMLPSGEYVLLTEEGTYQPIGDEAHG